jgi:hypothetical protein
MDSSVVNLNFFHGQYFRIYFLYCFPVALSHITFYYEVRGPPQRWYKSYIEENPGNLEGTDNGEIGRVVRRRSEWTVRIYFLYCFPVALSHITFYYEVRGPPQRNSEHQNNICENTVREKGMVQVIYRREPGEPGRNR